MKTTSGIFAENREVVAHQLAKPLLEQYEKTAWMLRANLN